MTLFLAKTFLFLAWTVLVFVAGHFTALHPDDTRTFLTRVKASVSSLFQRDPKGGTK